MRSKIFALVAAMSLFAGGCGSLIPKRVELFQDKVRAVPELKQSERETQRQAAALAAKRAEETLVAAVSNAAPADVLIPAKDTAVLTEAVSDSLGPPAKPWEGEVNHLATKLDSSMAALNRRFDEFEADNNQNAGKKIEGTGVFQVPYFVWIGGALVLAFIGFIVLSLIWGAVKMFAASNPPVALGVNAAQLAGKTVSRGFSQLIKGGERFKEAVTEKFGSTDVANEVLELFQREQMKTQDHDVQTAVQHLTK